MRFLIISDIHGNSVALDAVLKAVPKNRYNKILVLGDCIGDGPCPDEVINTLSKYDTIMIKGNREQLSCDYMDGTALETLNSIQWKFMRDTTKLLSDEQINYLRQLPQTRTVSHENVDILMVHGSPFNIRELLYIDKPERITECLDSISQQILLCGHNHSQFAYFHNCNGIEKLALNPGSVGLCQTGEAFRADYALLEVHNGQIAFELNHTYYKGNKVKAQFQDRNLFDGHIWGKIAYKEMSEGKLYIISFARYVHELARRKGASTQPIPDDIWIEAEKSWDFKPV